MCLVVLVKVVVDPNMCVEGNFVNKSAAYFSSTKPVNATKRAATAAGKFEFFNKQFTFQRSGAQKTI